MAEARKIFNAARELKKLKAIVEALPEDKKKISEGIVADLAFMAEQLEILRKDITVNGWSEEYQNGANQSGRKSRVEADAYVKLQKSYSSTVKQLTDLLPVKEETTAGAELMAFVNRSRD